MMQAAVLAAILIPLGSVAVETATISCGFGPEGYGGESCSALAPGEEFFSPSPTTSRFNFGEYYLELMFVLVPGVSFDVTVETTEMDQESFQMKADAFPDYTCIELTATGGCIDFEVRPSEEQMGSWLAYQLEIRWRKWEGQQIYDPALMRILHDIGDSGSRDYDEDMCLTALTDDSYLMCQPDPDPGIRSGDTDFRSFTAALAPTAIPEPSSLLLLATGVSGVLYRRRRRSKV